MSTHFSDRLLNAIEKKGSPVCVGIDPVASRLPKSLVESARRRAIGMSAGDPSMPGSHTGGRHGSGFDRLGGEIELDATCEFVSTVLDAVRDHVPAVKFQAACFERYRHAGVEAMWELISDARDMGFIVILDAKRGDIGVSSDHYAAGIFNPPEFDTDVFGTTRNSRPDAVTLSPYMGRDSVEPFLKGDESHGAFALVRTSNPGGDELQLTALADGSNIAQRVACLVDSWGSGHMGTRGYSNLGAVVGATKAAEIPIFRELMPRTIMLVPGYGAQGATSADIKGFFNRGKHGALITASRSVIFAFASSEAGQPQQTAAVSDWGNAVARAARAFALEVAASI